MESTVNNPGSLADFANEQGLAPHEAVGLYSRALRRYRVCATVPFPQAGYLLELIDTMEPTTVDVPEADAAHGVTMVY